MINWNKDSYWHGEVQEGTSSLILDPRYATKSARGIYTIEKNIILVIDLAIIVFVISLLDILALKSLLFTAVSLTYTMIIASLLIAIGTLIFMLRKNNFSNPNIIMMPGSEAIYQNQNSG
jgi:hypothetical protein